MLHFSCLVGCGWFATHHADKCNQLFYQFGIGMRTLARGIIEAVLETYADGRGAHADGTSEDGEVLHRVVGDTP